MDTKTIVVTIGRNVGATPMDHVSWEGFQGVIRDGVTGLKGLELTAMIVGKSVSKWGEEEAAWFSFTYTGTNYAGILHTLRAMLPFTARHFFQEAIGMIVDGAYEEVTAISEEELMGLYSL